MNLPTQAQVNAASRHIASAAGGAIMMFGLATKINPDTVKAIVTATGNLINDAVVLIGLISPLVAAFFASRSSSDKAHVQATQVLANTGGPQQEAAQIAVLNAAASLPTTAKIINPALASVTVAKVTAQ